MIIDNWGTEWNLGELQDFARQVDNLARWYGKDITDFQKTILNMLNEACEDYYWLIMVGIREKCVIFYKEQNDVKLFLDYEKACYDTKEYLELLAEEDLTIYKDYLDTHFLPEGALCNLVYNEEEIEVTTYPNLLKLLYNLLEPNSYELPVELKMSYDICDFNNEKR